MGGLGARILGERGAGLDGHGAGGDDDLAAGGRVVPHEVSGQHDAVDRPLVISLGAR